MTPPRCVAPQEEVTLGCVYCLYASLPFYSFLLSFSAQEIPQQQEVEFQRAGEGGTYSWGRWFRVFFFCLISPLTGANHAPMTCGRGGDGQRPGRGGCAHTRCSSPIERDCESRKRRDPHRIEAAGTTLLQRNQVFEQDTRISQSCDTS